MPEDIMSSEPMHSMAFGQLVMAVQCCAVLCTAATLCHLSQCTRWYLVSWSWLCSVVLRYGVGGASALDSHDQLAKYYPEPLLR